MNTNNKIHTFGDNNIDLQNITARDINIISGKETSPEVKNKKQELAEKIVNLIHKLADLQGETNNIIVEQKFNDIYWDDLIEAIEVGNCILFIGQDIAKDEKENSLHDNFFKSISRQKIKYIEQDGFFMPGADNKINTKALKFYSQEFETLNKKGYEILKKIAQIPFSLIISVSPDDTMHKIYEKYNINHKFLFYNETEQNVEIPSIKNPVIYNLLGNTALNGKYIFTHEQFYKYINTKQVVKIPKKLETKVKKAAHYLFIGIDFNKWYNRLLLFTLNLDDETDSFSLNEEKIKEINQDFVKQQFNVSFIDSKYLEFTNLLLQKCQKNGINRPLINTFTKNTLKDIEIQQNKAIDTDSLEKLSEIENNLKNIFEKINKHN